MAGRAVLAIDPGTTESAIVRFDGKSVLEYLFVPNEHLLSRLYSESSGIPCVIEQISSMGMAVGAEIFDTCVWVGRFMEAYGSRNVYLLPRLKVKLQLCGTHRAKDANVRAAILERFGGSAAIGSKKSPGPLYGISGHGWSALAVAIAWLEMH